MSVKVDLLMLSAIYAIKPLNWLLCEHPEASYWFAVLPVEINGQSQLYACQDVLGRWVASDADKEVGPPRKRASDAKRDAWNHFVKIVEPLLCHTQTDDT